MTYQNRRIKRKSFLTTPKGIILMAFGLVSIITAILAFIFIRNLVSGWTLGTLPGAPVAGAVTGTDAAGTPFTLEGEALQPVGGPTPSPWDGSSRVTLLVMGLDFDDTEARKTPRTDSMMLFSMDPASKSAGIMSIPRDLWVNIPGFDYGKINTAYFLGESYKLPGGGAGLAVETVQDFLGVPINYYAQVDFDAFVKFIDEIGGVDIDVPMKTKISIMGGYSVTDENGRTYSREEKTLKKGLQWMDGRTALGYARSRYSAGGDYDRAARQQQVVDAVRKRILAFNMLPTLVTKAPKLYADLSQGIKTNLSMNQIVQLALFAAQIPSEKIHYGLITEDSAYQAFEPTTGQSVLIPIMEKIRVVRDETFATGGALGPSQVSSDPVALMKAEGARVSIRNGSGVANLAEVSTIYFQQQGVNVVEQGSGEFRGYSYIIDITGKPYTMAYFQTVLGIGPAQVSNASYDPNSPVDVIVVLGDDWANSGKMGNQ